MMFVLNKMIGKSKIKLWLARFYGMSWPDMLFIIIFLMATCLSCVIAWATPPFSIPDEGAHYLRGFEVSRGHLINVRGNVGIPIPCSDYLKIAKLNGRVNVAFYQAAAEEMKPSAEDCVVSSVNTAGSYSAIPYIAAAFGIRTAEVLGYGVETRLKTGRMANAIVTSLICLLAVLAVKKYRLLIAIFALLPMSMWLRASLSADALTISISIGYLAYLLHLVEKDVPITKRNICILTLLAIALGSVKPVYAILSFSVLILYKRSKGLSGLMLLALPGISALLVGALWSLAADPTLIYINNFNGANPVAQLEYIMSDPLNFSNVVINTFRINLTSFIGQAIVPMFPAPWVQQYEQFGIGITICVLVLFTMVTMPTSLIASQRLVLIAVTSTCLIVTVIPLYLTYTLVGHNEILGLQGRYFLPTAFYAVIAGCINKPLHIFASESTRFTVAVIIPLIISTTLVIQYLG